MNIVTENKGSHWYAKDGTACHTTIGKNGATRPTTLRDARKEGWMPSVTSILKIKNKPQLEGWKQSQAILAAMTLPRLVNETDQEFVNRVVEDMGEQSKKAAEFGTSIHKEIERINLGQGDLFSGSEYVKGYEKWFHENITQVIHAEKVLVNVSEGYAGTVDLVAVHKEWGNIVLDVKTQNVKDKPVFYPEFEPQLAAYAECLDMAIKPKLVSCIINSVTPSEPVFKVWEDGNGAWKEFQALKFVWNRTNNYFPVDNLMTS